MKMRLMSVLAVLIMLTATANTWAVSLNPFRRNGRAPTDTLMITANVVNARLLAELAQLRTKQPILLFSPDVDGTQQIFYLAPGEKATSIGEDKFVEMVDFINPKRVIILGSNDFVPNAVVDRIRQRYSIIILDSTDWDKNAQALGEWLDHSALLKQYREYNGKLSQVNTQK